MQWQRIVKGAFVGILIAYVPLAMLRSTEDSSGVGILSLPLGAFIGGYLAGEKTGGAICGVIVDGMLWVYGGLLLQEGSLAGLLILLLWILLLVPLTLIGLTGGFVALRRRQTPVLERSKRPPKKPHVMAQDTPSPNKTGAMFCPACGTVVASDTQFCPHCGISL